MNIGRRIYYDLTTGNIIQDTGERAGDVTETTIEQDFKAYVSLAERVPKTVGMLQLEYGQYRQDFEDGGVKARVNLETKQLEFIYLDPGADPEQPQEPIYTVPLTERITAVEAESAGIALELAVAQSRLDQAEIGQANLFLSLVEGGII